MHFNTGTVMLLVIVALAVCGVLWFLADLFVLAPRREAAAQAAAQHQLRQMQFAAGIRPGMPRRQRRHRGRLFAKKMQQLARASGTLDGMPRHEVLRRTKSLAKRVATGVA